MKKIKKQNILCMVALGAMTALNSCSSKMFLVTSASENLTVLTKITESETTVSECAFGGYDYKGLLLAVEEKKNGNINIFRKDNPLSPSLVQVTSGNNFNNNPTFCLSTGRIAFTKYTRGTTADIYMIDAKNASALTPVTETSGFFEWEPSFSKDGNFIAYHRTTSARYSVNAEIWLKNLKTNETMMLGSGMGPKISPDGKKIVYYKYNTSATECNIWMMNIDGSDARQLTSSKREWAQNPCWSQDGKYVVFSSSNEQKRDYDLYVMSSDGTGLKQITNNDSYDGCPYWGPDNMIYFTSDRGAKKGENQIWRFNYRP